MNFFQGKTSTLAMMIVGTFLLGGCFGPFKKKSSGGGGGGGATEEEGTDPDEATKTAGETPAEPGTPPPPGAKDGFGCLQGVVTDGFTGQRIALDASKVFVLIRGTKVPAYVVPDDDNLKGEYFICNIPVEETYPVYAYLDGYMPFESSVMIVSTRAKRVAADGQAVVDEVKIPDPLEMQNIRLFPLGNTTRDLRVRAVYNGGAVKDAIVDLEAQSAGAAGTFAFEGTFANSAGTRILPMRAMTGDDGYATFKAADLSLGASYKITVHPPVATDLTAPAHANLVLGVSGAAASDLNTYDLNVVLGEANMALSVISCSTQFQADNSVGSIKIMFNRKVSVIDPDNLDTAVAITAGAVGTKADPLALGTIIANNNASETVTFGVSGNVLTLTPKFDQNDTIKPLESADPSSTVNTKNKDATATWTFANVKLKVAGDADANNVPLSSLTGALVPACNNVVRFFAEID